MWCEKEHPFEKLESKNNLKIFAQKFAYIKYYNYLCKAKQNDITMKHLNPIKAYKLVLVKESAEKGILKLTERFSVEKYINLLECSKSVSKRLKKLRSNGYHGKVYIVKESGAEEFLKQF